MKRERSSGVLVSFAGGGTSRRPLWLVAFFMAVPVAAVGDAGLSSGAAPERKSYAQVIVATKPPPVVNICVKPQGFTDAGEPAVFFSQEESIAGNLGRLLRIFEPTLALTQTREAFVCVELDICKVILERIWIRCGPKWFWQKIKYYGVPSLCSYYHKLGHAKSDCTRKNKKVDGPEIFSKDRLHVQGVPLNQSWCQKPVIADAAEAQECCRQDWLSRLQEFRSVRSVDSQQWICRQIPTGEDFRFLAKSSCRQPGGKIVLQEVVSNPHHPIRSLLPSDILQGVTLNDMEDNCVWGGSQDACNGNQGNCGGGGCFRDRKGDVMILSLWSIPSRLVAALLGRHIAGGAKLAVASHGRHGAQAREDEQRREERGVQQAPAPQGPKVLPPPPPVDYAVFMQGLVQAMQTQAQT
ncbi:hypothetical protein Taro_018615 [Colocasia esculenta]|uniref:Uncharacterized protein n=1 Tax=Colocasia esculenta TaxID=4460 RepID=A0A843URH4_COLES|nr:hypothetical protein [Colocasia esculenta]